MTTSYSNLVKAISDKIGRGRPVLVCAGFGSGIVTASMEALGAGTKCVRCDVLEPTMRLPDPRGGDDIVVGGLQSQVAGGMPIVLDAVDRVQRDDVLDEIRHFLAMSSRPVVVTIHDKSALRADIAALCGESLSFGAVAMEYDKFPAIAPDTSGSVSTEDIQACMEAIAASPAALKLAEYSAPGVLKLTDGFVPGKLTAEERAFIAQHEMMHLRYVGRKLPKEKRDAWEAAIARFERGESESPSCPGCDEKQPEDQTNPDKLCDSCSEEARGVKGPIYGRIVTDFVVNPAVKELAELPGKMAIVSDHHVNSVIRELKEIQGKTEELECDATPRTGWCIDVSGSMGESGVRKAVRHVMDHGYIGDIVVAVSDSAKQVPFDGSALLMAEIHEENLLSGIEISHGGMSACREAVALARSLGAAKVILLTDDMATNDDLALFDEHVDLWKCDCKCHEPGVVMFHLVPCCRNGRTES